MTYADHGKAILVELPKHSIPVGSEQMLENLKYRGFTPVIAHPERNSTLRRTSGRVEDWIAMGCKLQLTAQSCSGDFGESVEKVCHYWCEMGWVHLVASDGHRTQGRKPDMRAGTRRIKSWLGVEAARLMTIDNPGRLIKGEDLESIVM